GVVQSLILGKLYNSKQMRVDIQESMKEKEKQKKLDKKNTKKIVIKDSESNNEKEISEKEYYKLRLEKARELDRQKYEDDSQVSLIEETTNAIDENEKSDNPENAIDENEKSDNV
ncbi:MAG: hypothetical protein ACRCZK_00250, partial [Oscillospiraceae bacterium]